MPSFLLFMALRNVDLPHVVSKSQESKKTNNIAYNFAANEWTKIYKKMNYQLPNKPTHP